MVGEVGKDDFAVVADHHVQDRPLAVKHQADLTAQLPRQFGQFPGQLRGDDQLGGDTAAGQPLKGLDLPGTQTGEVAVQHRVSAEC